MISFEGHRRFLWPSMNLSGYMWCMTKARTYRFTAHMEARIQRVADENGGISMQAAVTMLVARGLAIVEAESHAPANAPSGRKFTK